MSRIPFPILPDPHNADRLPNSSYHWALVVEPKKEAEGSRGHGFHAKETLCFSGTPAIAETVWHYEGREVAMVPTSMLLVRVLIGKVKNMSRLRKIIKDTPVRAEDEGWNCVGWVKEAATAVLEDGKALGTKARDWMAIKDTAMQYVEKKKASHRFDGSRTFDPTKAATWDMLDGVEQAP